LKAVNETVLATLEVTQTIVRLTLAQDEDVEAEVDEMWSFVQSKQHQRGLWWAIDHATGQVLAYVLATDEDEAFLQLKALLEPFGIMPFYSVRVACRRLRLGSIRTAYRTCVSYRWQATYSED
jgi:insertion element IS1 protein InsB